MKISNYKEFLLLEFEGGPASHQPVKVGDGMMVDIILDDEEGEEEEDKDIDILHDLSEGVDNDPYNEETDIDLPEKSYKMWHGSLYDFLMQYGDPEIVKSLHSIENCSSSRDASNYIEDILASLEEEIDWADYRRIYDEIDILYDLVHEDEDDRDRGPDPDEAYDRSRLEEF